MESQVVLHMDVECFFFFCLFIYLFKISLFARLEKWHVLGNVFFIYAYLYILLFSLIIYP